MAVANSKKISNFFRGDTRTFKFEVVDSLDVPVDITGWIMFFTMKDDLLKGDDEAVAQVQSVMPVSVDSTNGIGYIILESTVTELIEPGAYFYDFQRVLLDPPNPPKVTTFLSGKIKVLTDVTLSVGTP